MSNRRVRPSSSGDDTVKLTLLTSSGKKGEMEISLRDTSLAALKTSISSNSQLGNIPVRNQRLFYMGREMKTAGRSLESLGVGKLGVWVVHVHNTRPKCNSTAASAPVAAAPAAPTAGDYSRAAAAIAQRAAVASLPRRRQQQRQQQQQPPAAAGEVVDLADSDSDDDDDVCIVDVVQTASSARSKRQRVA